MKCTQPYQGLYIVSQQVTFFLFGPAPENSRDRMAKPRSSAIYKVRLYSYSFWEFCANQSATADNMMHTFCATLA